MNLVPIQITLQAANAVDMRNLVLQLAITLDGMPAAEVPAETKVSTVEAPVKKSDMKAQKEREAQKEAAVVEEVAAATATEEGVAEAIPTDVELRALAAAKAKSAGKQAVKDLLDKYGSASITAVPNESRIAFRNALEEL